MLAIALLASAAVFGPANPALALAPYQPPDQQERLLAEAETTCRIKREQGQRCRVLDLSSPVPNYFNLAVAQAFRLLQDFALADSPKPDPKAPLAVRPGPAGSAQRLTAFLKKAGGAPGAALLRGLLPAAEKFLPGADPDLVAHQMSRAALGDAELAPGRLFPLARVLAEKYLAGLLPGSAEGQGLLALPASDPQAAWEALFLALHHNRALRYGDWIGVIRPIGAGGLAPAGLKRYRHINLHLARDPQKGWVLPLEEVAKLNDSKLAGLFLANPPALGGPALSRETLAQIAKVARYKNPRLVVLAASQLAGGGAAPLADFLPFNLITVYSFGPRYGLAGWGAGLLAMPRDNLPDELISRLSLEERWKVVKRYAPDGVPSKETPFVRRLMLEAKWRGGLSLSGPRQAMVALYSLFGLQKDDLGYARAVDELLAVRAAALLAGMGWENPPTLRREGPFAQLPLGRFAAALYGPEFAGAFLAKPPEVMLSRLARRYHAVATPIVGDLIKPGALLISLAGLSKAECGQLGEWLGREMKYFYYHWRAEQWGRVLAPLVKLDHALFRLLNRTWTNPVLDRIMPPVSQLLPLVPLVLIGVWLLWKGGVRGRYVFGGCVILFLFTDFCLSQFLRTGLGRIAPFADLVGVRRLLSDGWRLTTQMEIANFGLAFSLPSAHAANSMGPAIYLSAFHPRLRRWLVPMALLVGWSRSYLGVHFPGDLLVGYLWGGMWGWALAWGTKKIMEVCIKEPGIEGFAPGSRPLQTRPGRK